MYLESPVMYLESPVMYLESPVWYRESPPADRYWPLESYALYPYPDSAVAYLGPPQKNRFRLGSHFLDFLPSASASVASVSCVNPDSVGFSWSMSS